MAILCRDGNSPRVVRLNRRPRIRGAFLFVRSHFHSDGGIDFEYTTDTDGERAHVLP